jgi:hypothetical protein
MQQPNLMPFAAIREHSLQLAILSINSSSHLTVPPLLCSNKPSSSSRTFRHVPFPPDQTF